MTLSPKFLRAVIILVPLIVFIAALMLDGFSYQYTEIVTPKGYMLLLMGGISFVGGGLFETIIWLANPIALFAVIRFLREHRIRVTIDPILNTTVPKPPSQSGWLSALAAVISLSFSLWDEVLAAESGSMGKILGLHTGYWLWTLSFSIFAIGVTFYNFRYKRDDF